MTPSSQRRFVALAAFVLVPATALLSAAPVYADNGPYNTTPAVRNVTGLDEQFTIGGSVGCTVLHRWRSTPNLTGAWSSMGGCVLSGVGWGLDVGKNQNGKLVIFAVAPNGTVWHDWLTSPGRGPWSGWYSMGGTAYSGAHVLSEFSGYYPEIFVGVDDYTHKKQWINHQTQPSCCWSGWKLSA
jgi:hypothetical protein